MSTNSFPESESPETTPTELQEQTNLSCQRQPRPSELEEFNERLIRAGRLLDQWLDAYEIALETATPDANKVSEMLSVFAILKKKLEIIQLHKKLVGEEQQDESGEAFRLDPKLFGE